jgi:hypothetical protein
MLLGIPEATSIRCLARFLLPGDASGRPTLSRLVRERVGRSSLPAFHGRRVPLDKSEGVVKAQNSLAVFFSPRAGQSWWRTEAL